MRYLFIISLLFFITSCTTKYVKSGGTQSEFYQAKTDCQLKQKAMGYNSQNDMFGIATANYFSECMAGQGWYPEKK